MMGTHSIRGRAILLTRIWSPPILQALVLLDDRDRIASVYPACLLALLSERLASMKIRAYRPCRHHGLFDLRVKQVFNTPV